MGWRKIRLIVRDAWVGELHRLGVKITPYARLYGTSEDAVYFKHTVSHEPIVLAEVDTLVVAQGYQRDAKLFDSLSDFAGQLGQIGDCVQPRTVEEAILEGLTIAAAL